jgi:methionyl-tRNA formyltransferase
MTRAVVFAYHNVGVRCLKVLLAHGVEVSLVVTHGDAAQETIWFESVAEAAALYDLPLASPAEPNTAGLADRIAGLRPDFLFSFYYRRMLKATLLRLASRGAYNMHGSLLPKYRGRAPVNWAVINGERETGASLHCMVEEPDAGPIVGQQAVPIFPDDTAFEVFNKVTVAAELVLDRALPSLIDDSASHVPQDLGSGSYFGARAPDDGRIDWSAPAHVVHNLIRGVAPPYPGAFGFLRGSTLRVLGSLEEHRRGARDDSCGIYCDAGRIYADCGDHRVLRLTALEYEEGVLDPARFSALFGPQKIPFDRTPYPGPA